jgi:hypothetical protein
MYVIFTAGQAFSLSAGILVRSLSLFQANLGSKCLGKKRTNDSTARFFLYMVDLRRSKSL